LLNILHKNSVFIYLRFQIKILVLTYSKSSILIVVRCVYVICWS